jgi:PAS domain S-box-containing protein
MFILVWVLTVSGLGIWLLLDLPLAQETPSGGWFLRLDMALALALVALLSWLAWRTIKYVNSMQQALLSSENRLQRITAHTLDVICEIDGQGVVQYASPSFQTVLGYEPDSVIGQAITSYLHPQDLPTVESVVQEAIKHWRPVEQMELRIRCAAGNYIWLEVLSQLVYDEQGATRSAVLVGRDITQRLKSQEEKARYARRLAALYTISLEINSQPDTSTLLSIIVQRGSELLGTRLGSIYKVGAPDQAVVLVASQPPELTGIVLRLGEGVAGRVVLTGAPVVVPDYSSWPHRSSAFEGVQFGRVLAVPLKVRQQIIGVLVIDDDQPGDFSEDDVRLASLLADQAALAIENRQLLEQMQTELLQRQRAEQALRDSEQRYRLLIESQGEGICLVDENENLTFANPAADDLFGVPRGALTGHNLREFLMPQDFADILKETQRRRTGQTSTYESPILRADGQRRFLLVTARPRFDENGEFLGAFSIFRDITERKQAEEELAHIRLDLEKRNLQLTEILEAGNLLRLTLDVDQVLREIVNSARRALRFRAIVLNYLDAAQRKFRVHSFAGLDEAGQQLLIGAEYDLDQELSLMRPEFALGRAYFIPAGTLDWEKDVRGPTYVPAAPPPDSPDAWGPSDALFIPLELRSGEIVATMWLDDPEDGLRPTLESLRPLEIFANQATTAIETARLFEAERQRRTEIEEIYQASMTLTTSLSLEQIFPSVVQGALLISRAKHAALYMCDGDELRFAAAVNEDGLLSQPPRVPRPGGLIQTVARTGEVIVVERPAAHPLLADEVLEAGQFAMIGIPLKIETTTIGVLGVEYTDPRPIPEVERRTLEAFAAQAAIAVQNARLHQQITLHAEQLEQRVTERTTELDHERQHLRAILDSAGEGIQMMDADGRIEYVNPATEHITGFTAAEMVGQLSRFWEHVNAVDSTVYSLVQQGQTWEGEIVNQRKDGTRYDSAVTVTPLLDRARRVTGYVVVHRDITRFKELDRLKSLFVQRIGHELLMPLAIIKTHVELLQRGKRDKLDRYILILREQVERQRHLLDSFLEISAMDAGRVEVHPIRLNLPHFLSDLIRGYEARAAARGLTFQHHHAPELDRHPVQTDQTLLGRTVNILLENAIAYAPRGTPITVSTALREEGGLPWCIVSIHNDGPGIAPKELPHMFERFYRGEAARDYKTPGAGLGLAIAQTAMHLLGGRITVESEPGAGVTFILWLK